jgi:hypothetical protein
MNGLSSTRLKLDGEIVTTILADVSIDVESQASFRLICRLSCLPTER